MLNKSAAALACFLFFLSSLYGQKILDNFESVSGWKTAAPGGSSVKINSVQIEDRRCMKIEADISGSSGMFAVQRDMLIDFPQNYTITFYMRGEPASLGFSFNLLDARGEMLLGYSRESISIGEEWVKYTIRQKDFKGMYNNPNIDRPMKRPEAIEFRFVSGDPKAVVYIAALSISEHTVSNSADFDPAAFASSNAKGFEVSKVFDKNLKNAWKSAGRQAKEHILIDFREVKSFGGIKIAWDSLLFAREFSVSVSDNAKDWTEAYNVKNGNGSISFVPIQDAEARYVKINMNKSNSKNGYLIKEIGILPPAFSASMPNVYSEIARMYSDGCFPKFYYQQNYDYRTFSLPGDPVKSAITSDGQIEIENTGLLIDPFIYSGKSLLTWKEAQKTELVGTDSSRILKTVRTYAGHELTIITFPQGYEDSCYLQAHYTIKNTSKNVFKGNFYLALRPLPAAFLKKDDAGIFQSLPVSTIEYDGRKAVVNSRQSVYMLQKPDAFGACEFDQGDISVFLETDSLPQAASITDPHAAASAAMRYRFSLKAGESKTFYFTLPLHTEFLPWYEGKDTAPDESWYKKQLDNYIKKKN